MFICDECHEKLGLQGMHLAFSMGPCEICHKVRECNDCHCPSPKPVIPIDLELVKKLYRIREDVKLVEQFGDPIGGGHLSGDDEDLEYLWFWDFKDYYVVTVDEGNGYCRVLYAERKSNGQSHRTENQTSSIL